MKLNGRYLLAAILALTSFLLFYAHSHRILISEHNAYDFGLDHLYQVDTLLNDNVLKARSNLLDDYDMFSLQVEDLRRTITSLRSIPKFIPPADRLTLLAKLDQFAALLDQKERLIQEFTSVNARLHNSLTYLPVASDELLSQLSTESENGGIRETMETLMQRLFISAVGMGNEQAPQIHRMLDELSRWRQQHAGSAEAKSAGIIAAHVRSILDHQPRSEELTRQLLSLPTGSNARAMDLFYVEHFDLALAHADRARLILQILCAALILGVSYTIVALDSARRNLERHVVERTGDLQAEIVERRRIEEERDRYFTASIDLLCVVGLDGYGQRVNPAFQIVLGRTPEECLSKPIVDFVHPDDRAALQENMQRLMTGEAVRNFTIRLSHKDGSYRWIAWSAAAAGKEGLIYPCGRDVTEQRRIEDALRLTQATVDNSPDGVWWLDSEARFVYANKAACRSVGYTREELIGMRLTDIDPLSSSEDWAALWKSKNLSGIMEGRHRTKTGQTFPIEVTLSRILFGDHEYICAFTRDISDRKQAEAALEKAHNELLEISRQAGMAEVATGVLHNVGNVLNSANVSATLAVDYVKKSKMTGLGRLVGLLDHHAADLGAFVTLDARGKNLPIYLQKLHDQLTQDHQNIVAEVESLRKNIEHICEIVAMQQDYAKVSGVTEVLSVVDLVEDSLRMNEAALLRHDVAVEREFQQVPQIGIEKHKALQILVNLIRNAKYACDEGGREEKRITLRVTNGDNSIKIAIADNGVGIPTENLTRIFNHGFTTRKDGHGFGLHSGALAARELGGSLMAHSDGVGRGATFILELPLQVARS